MLEQLEVRLVSQEAALLLLVQLLFSLLDHRLNSLLVTLLHSQLVLQLLFNLEMLLHQAVLLGCLHPELLVLDFDEVALGCEFGDQGLVLLSHSG